MGSVLEDVVADELEPAYVERRVEDWAARIELLYGTIESWLPQGWSAERRRVVPMDEELMRHYGVRARDLPVLEVLEKAIVRATLQPHGLWVVATNGRVDLWSNQGLFLILDMAKSFHKPDWRVTSAADRSQFRPLSREAFFSIL